jgi:membrane protein
MIVNFASIWKLLKEAAKEWDKDKCPRLGAALSYYTFFSFAPVLVIAIAIAGFFFGAEAAQGQVVNQLRGLIGTDGAVAVQLLLENAWKNSDGGVVATIIAFVVLLVGATGAFIELQDSLNTVWQVTPKPGRGIKGFVKDRLTSFGVVVGVGFLLLVSLVISAALTALNTYLSSWISGVDWLWSIVDVIVSFFVVMLLFAMVYKILPDVELEWRDVWIGAAFTSLLFSIGKYLIGLYIGNSSIASSYGAAGSLVVLLVWVYYSAQIMLFGAELTEVYVKHKGRFIRPAPYAVALAGSYCDPQEQKRIIANAKQPEALNERS